MNLTDSLPTLRILPVENLLLHENYDSGRAESLIERLESEGLLRNPPIIIPLNAGASQFVVLDGANRTTALRRMGISHVLAQVVEPGHRLCLKNWNHVLLDTDINNFLDALRAIPSLEVQNSNGSHVSDDTKNHRFLGWVFLATGEHLTLSYPSNDHMENITMLNRLEHSCRESGRLERTNLHSMEALKLLHPKMSALVVYHLTSLDTILSVAQTGNLLPAGITRFLVSPRALRVNYPLKELVADKPLGAKNNTLQMWIQSRITERGVRCYEESTIMFDE
ncbi:MAG: bifunctional transcriptional regulator/O-phospho-L-serine synthase SbnI [Anaerolineales bacterium]